MAEPCFRKIMALLLAAVLCFSVFPLSSSAEESRAVYVKKHVSLLYDDSGSMKNQNSLKWAYASYAAQAFTGLLNDTDTLTVTFVGGKKQSLRIDLAADRQKQVDKVLANTGTDIRYGTVFAQIDKALEVLLDEGLSAGGGKPEDSAAEQYWLVLTTDGAFNHPQNADADVTEKELAEKLSGILRTYPAVNIIYCAFGSTGSDVIDLRNNKDLKEYANFHGYYASSQEEIVRTVGELSSWVSGRYAVTENVRADKNTVTLTIDEESSPIRNVAVLLQDTDAVLQEAVTGNGQKLDILRNVRIGFPTNSDYKNVPAGTRGGSVALITGKADNRIPSGKVTLTFSDAVDAEDVMLMFEPAIYVRVFVEEKAADGKWEAVGALGRLDAGKDARVRYEVCEDGTDKTLDVNKLFGKNEAVVTYDGEKLKANGAFKVKEGSAPLQVFLNLMDGTYQISTKLSVEGITYSAKSFLAKSAGPLSLSQSDFRENRTERIVFTVSYAESRKPVEPERLKQFRVTAEGPSAKAVQFKTEYAEGGVITILPYGEAAPGDYTVTLSFGNEKVIGESLTVVDVPTYHGTAGQSLSVLDNELETNEKSVSFYVYKKSSQGEFPITGEEASLFTVKAQSGEGRTLEGKVRYDGDGVLSFIPGGKAPVGNYTVSLLYEGTALAETTVAVLLHDAEYRVAVSVPDDPAVNIMGLADNEKAVSFAVYADGAPCSAEQLRALVGSGVITVTTGPEIKTVHTEILAGTVNGDNGLRCTPKWTSKSGIGRLFAKVGAAFGAVPEGPLTVTLTVDMPKGDEGSGTLTLYMNESDRIFIFTVLLILLAVLAVIGWLLWCNIQMIRLYPGRIIRYTLTLDAYGSAYEIKGPQTKKIPFGFSFPVPMKQRIRCGGLSFTAGSREKRRGLFRYAVPNALVTVTKDNEKNHSSGGIDGGFLALLGMGGKVPLKIVQDNISTTPCFDGIIKDGETEAKASVGIHNGGYYATWTKNEGKRDDIELWIFKMKTKK